MSVNKSKVAALLKREEERAARMAARRKYVRYFKAKRGANKLRIMPPWTDEGANADQFWREVWTHWNIGEGGYLEKGKKFDCPLRTPDGGEEPCPICELVNSLYQTGNPADVELAKEIRAKPSYLINVVNLKDAVWTEEDYEEWEEDAQEGAECPFEVGDSKVQLWSCPSGVFKEILDYFMDKDLTDFEEGRCLVLTREGKGRYDTRYRTKIENDDSSFYVEGEFESVVNDLDQVGFFASYEVMNACLHGQEVSAAAIDASDTSKFLPPMDEDTSEEEEEEEYEEEEEEEEVVAAPPKKKKARKRSKKSVTSDVDALEESMRRGVQG